LLAVWLLLLGLWRCCLPQLLTMMMMLVVRFLVWPQIVGRQVEVVLLVTPHRLILQTEIRLPPVLGCCCYCCWPSIRIAAVKLEVVVGVAL
jgi:hypothetical protein